MQAPVQQSPAGRHGAAGFTIIEILIVVGIIGILMSIAVPAYNGYVIRGKFAEAAAHLTGQRIRLEQYYQDNRNYGVGADCGLTIPATRFFTYTCTLGGSDQEYTLTANGTDSTAGFSFTLNQGNVRTTAAVPSGWNLPTPNNCWIQKKSGTC